MKKIKIAVAFAILFTLTAPMLRAAAMIEVDAGTPSTTLAPVYGNDLSDLVSSFITRQNQFQSLSGQPYFANLNYAGIANAIRFNVNSSGTQASLTGLGGLNVSFTATNNAVLNQQIKDWLKKNGGSAWANFMRAVNQQSPVAPADGNPTSITAMMASQTYAQYSSAPSLTREEKEAGSPSQPNGLSLGFVADYGHYTAQGFKGDSYTLPIFAKLKFSDRVTLGIDLPLRYTEMEGSKTYSIGLGLALPVKIIKAGKDQPWTWILTPSAGAQTFGSEELLAAGLIANGGISSMLSYDFAHFTLAMGNQYGRYEGVPVTVGNITVDPGVRQEILRNGLQVSIPIGRRWVADLYGIYTTFLEAAYMHHYYTVGGDIGFRFGKLKKSAAKRGYTKIGIYADLADKYTVPHLQFGTDWKF